MVGRGGLIFAPYVVVMLFENYGPGGVVLVLSSLYLALAVVVALFGIETNQQSLEALAPAAEPPVETNIVLENKRV
jgi:putative MFS transporter